MPGSPERNSTVRPRSTGRRCGPAGRPARHGAGRRRRTRARFGAPACPGPRWCRRRAGSGPDDDGSAGRCPPPGVPDRPARARGRKRRVPGVFGADHGGATGIRCREPGRERELGGIRLSDATPDSTRVGRSAMLTAGRLMTSPTGGTVLSVRCCDLALVGEAENLAEGADCRFAPAAPGCRVQVARSAFAAASSASPACTSTGRSTERGVWEGWDDEWSVSSTCSGPGRRARRHGGDDALPACGDAGIESVPVHCARPSGGTPART